MQISQILEVVRSNSGKNFKVEVLKEHSENILLKEVLIQTYSPLIRFGISPSQVPEYSPTQNEKCLGLEWALEQIKPLSSREVTGNLAKTHIQMVLSSLSKDNSDIVMGILKGTQSLGCNVSSINKAMSKIIHSLPYMGAEPYTPDSAKNIINTGESVLQFKCDGMFLNVSLSGSVKTESRQGLECYFGSVFDNLAILESLYGEPLVLNGELLIKNEPSRYIANGQVSSMNSIGEKIMLNEDVSKELDKFEKRFGCTYESKINDLYLVVWDMIPLSKFVNGKWDRLYFERMKTLQSLLEQASLDNIEFVETHQVHNVKEAESITAKWIQNGFEGGILKSNSIWKKGKNKKTAIKYKLEVEFEMLLTGYKLGSGKNKGKISSLQVTTACHELITYAAGLTEDDMDYFTANIDDLIQSKVLVQIKCCGLSQDKHGKYSLLHPVYMGVRTDKEVANTLDECKLIQQSVIDTKASLGIGTVNLTSPSQSKCEQSTRF